jgi:hypothetical protein
MKKSFHDSGGIIFFFKGKDKKVSIFISVMNKIRVGSKKGPGPFLLLSFLDSSPR